MAPSSKDFTISDLTGGYNDSDPATSLRANQCVTAENVDFFRAPCGARRKGCTAISIPSSLSSKAHIPFLYKHIPASDLSEAQLWVFASTPDASFQLAYKSTAWTDVTFVHDPVNTGVYPYQFVGKSFHGKLFLAYKSNVDQLHVWDGVTLRPTGLLQPDPPVVIGQGLGALGVPRYYRIREIYRVSPGSPVLLMSEPSTSVEFNTAGFTNTLITVGAQKNPFANAWRAEVSVDNATFYFFSQNSFAFTTVTDSVALVDIPDTPFVFGDALSPDVGDYETIPSGRFLIVDQDRLVIGGSFEDVTQASVIRWTPVLNDPGFGNDERIPLDTDSALNLDGSEEGGLTDMAGPIFNSIYGFKQNRIYQLTRTGNVTAAYTAVAISKSRGALGGSVVEAVDEAGRPALYFLDPRTGPVRLSDGGFPGYQVLLSAGDDIIGTWDTVNIDATTVVCRTVYYPTKRQINWWLATNGSNTPNVRINLQIDNTETSKDGVHLGWTKHTGTSATAISACMFASNIDDGVARSIMEKPLIGVDNMILMMDNGNTDNGTDFTATTMTRPYLLSGTTSNRFGIRAGSIIGEADNTAIVKVSLVRDFGRETSPIVNIPMAPEGSENPVIQSADNLRMSSAKTVQVKLTDGDGSVGQWAVHRIDLTPRAEETD